jgi:hypothetical protein
MLAPAITLVLLHFVWLSAMPRIMPDLPLRFTLGSGQSLPCHLGWRIEDGYLRMTSWSAPVPAGGLARSTVWTGQPPQGEPLVSGEDLTHRQRAEIAGVTRVTVTQALSHYRQAGMMVRAGNDELLMGEGRSLRPATIHRAGRCARGHAGRRTRRRADHR